MRGEKKAKKGEGMRSKEKEGERKKKR